LTETLKLLSSMAPREVLAAAVAIYKDSHPTSIETEAAGGVEIARRVAAGESVDVVVLSSDAIDALIKGGQLSAASRVDLMNSEIAVAVPAGAAHPNIADETAMRAAVLAATSVSYSTGPSGRYLEKLFDRWGILDSLRARIVVPPPGVPVARLVVSGEVKLGFQQLSELLGVPGIEVLGPLPATIQQVTTFTGAATAACRSPDTARELLSFLASARLDTLKQRYGMAGVE
jgi:molybdate transport system substrate-binding protein